MKIKSRWLIVGILIFVMSFFFAGCSQQASQDVSKKGKTLVYGAEHEYEKINPILAETNVDDLIFSGLTAFDENNQAVPDLAENWDVSPDGLSYTFHLRQDVKWHDGQPFTAEDVKFTLDAVRNPRLNSPVSQEFEQVKEVKALDKYTVQVTLKNSFPPFLEKLATGIIPKHLLEGKDINTASFNTKPVGTGPYKFQQWDKGSTITLVANQDYHRGSPKIEQVIFKFLPDPNVRLVQLQTGEIDLAYLEPDQLARAEKMENVKIYEVPTADYRVMMYNFKDPLWRDLRVRKALNYAVNRQEIVDGVLFGKGKPAYGPLQLSWANNPNVEKYEYNMDKAKVLLAEAGWTPGPDGILTKNGQRFSFTLTCPITDPVRVAIANALATNFKQLGVEVKVEPLDWSAIKIDETQAFMLGWGSPYDPDDHTYKLFTSGQIGKGDNNSGSYSNKEVDRLLELARTTSDREERKKYYAEFQRVLAEDPPYNFICYLDAIFGVNKNVTGVKPKVLGHHGAGFIWNLAEWDLVSEE